MEAIYHSGIKGQKWGIRRWQYKDGSLTPEGYPHYGYNGPRKAAAKISNAAKSVAKSYRYHNVINSEKKANQARATVEDNEYNLSKARQAQSASAKTYNEATNSYNKAARKVDKINNSAYAKIIGYDGRTHRKANEQLAKTQDRFNIAERDYNAAKANTFDKEVELNNSINVTNTKIQTAIDKGNKFINRYGTDTYSDMYQKSSKRSKQIANEFYDTIKYMDFKNDDE